MQTSGSRSRRSRRRPAQRCGCWPRHRPFRSPLRERSGRCSGWRRAAARRRRDRGGDIADAFDGLADRLDGADQNSSVASCMLPIWLEISSVAFAVWPARLLTSCATTAKPRPASPARRLDGGVERQQIGLLGNRGDQLHDVADPGAGFRQFVDALVGGGRLLDGVGRDPVRFLDPAGDFRDRAGEFVEAVAAVRTCSEAVSEAPADLPESRRWSARSR